MSIMQISVFLENKPGRLVELTKILKENSINIRALCVSDTTEFGICRMIVDEPERCEKALRDNGKTVKLSRVLAVALPDVTGAMYTVVELLNEAQVNIAYTYALVDVYLKDQVIIILKVSDYDSAYQILKTNGIEILDGNTIQEKK